LKGNDKEESEVRRNENEMSKDKRLRITEFSSGGLSVFRNSAPQMLSSVWIRPGFGESSSTPVCESDYFEVSKKQTGSGGISNATLVWNSKG
jgi:hypothetical protein